jgi:hypothetical protein
MSSAKATARKRRNKKMLHGVPVRMDKLRQIRRKQNDKEHATRPNKDLAV